MEESNNKKHSEDYFGEPRNFWWNQDYLELIAKRIGLNNCHQMLDVGCGVGHWSRTLCHFLSKDAVKANFQEQLAFKLGMPTSFHSLMILLTSSLVRQFSCISRILKLP